MLSINISKTEKAYLYLISIICGLLLLIYSPKQNPKGTLPDFSLVNADSNMMVTKQTFTGKPLIVHFWASWCATCLPELVKYAEIQKKYPDTVYVAAINRRGSPSLSQVIADSLGISGGLNFLVDTDDTLYRTVKGRKMPLTLFVKENGSYEILEGSASRDEIEEKILTMFIH